MHHVLAEHVLALLATPTLVLVVRQEAPGAGCSQGVLEDADGQGVGVDRAEGRHDRRGQSGPQPVPAEDMSGTLVTGRARLRPRRGYAGA